MGLVPLIYDLIVLQCSFSKLYDTYMLKDFIPKGQLSKFPHSRNRITSGANTNHDNKLLLFFFSF